MRILRKYALLAIVACLSLSAGVGLRAHAQTRSLPEILYTADPDRPWPEFVSAVAAISAKGQIESKLLDPGSRRFLQNLLSQPPSEEGCLRQDEVWNGARGASQDRTSLAAAVRNSDLVIHGRVIAKSYGFSFGAGGHLVQISPVNGFDKTLELDSYFFFVPVGRFEAGPYTICKTDSRYHGELEMGDEVVLLVPEQQNPAEPYLFPDAASSLIVLRSDAEPRLPSWYRNESQRALHAVSSADLLQWIHSSRTSSEKDR